MLKNSKLWVDAETIAQDFDISKTKAYQIIRELNQQLKAARPTAIIFAGKVNRKWYEAACLNNIGKEDEV